MREELKEAANCYKEEELFSCLQPLMDKGILEPVRNSGTNGNQLYPIYQKYRIKVPKADYSEEIYAIRQLHPLLIQNGYLLKHPEVYSEYRTNIEAMSTYFFSVNSNEVSISRKERSFQIFKEEKLLDYANKGGRFITLLGKLGIGKVELNFYDTPSYCFSDYIPERKNELVILICENKDIWFNIRRIMYEDKLSNVFGADIDGVLLGNGTQITENVALTEYTAFLGADHVSYLYWGDIDRAGFFIYKQAIAKNPSLDISLFIPGYKMMMELAMRNEINNLPDSEDNREHEGFDDVISLFTDPYASYLSECLEKNKRLPQEIISYKILSDPNIIICSHR